MYRLIKVAPDENNNKYYNLSIVEGRCKAEFGRVGAAPQVAWYPASKMESKYREKLRKGYKDMTSISVVTSTGDIIVPPEVRDLYDLLVTASKESVRLNYVNGATGVTQAMIDQAQVLLDKLKEPKTKSEINAFNRSLVELFQVIPRKMANVSAYLYDGDFKEIITREQDALDAMSGQVITSEVTGTKSLKEAYGLSFEQINSEDDRIIQQNLRNFNRRLDNAWVVTNHKTQESYDTFVSSAKNKTTNLLWHGSRNENWLSIASKGLMIRPSNAVYTGSMFGDGIYFADKWKKSANYSSLKGSYWTDGAADYGLLALYQVHRGNSMEILRHKSSHYDLCASKLGPYDSVFAKGGADLINNEYIVYRPQQCTIKYLIKIS